MPFGENKVFRVIATVIIICSSLVCVTATASGERIAVIGFAARLTDEITHSPRDAAEMAIEEANQQADSTGSSIRFTLSQQDDQGNPNLAIFIANYFVKTHVSGVIGHWHSVTTLAAAETYEAARIPQINISTTNSLFTNLGYQSAFRVAGGTDDLAKTLAETAVDILHAQHVVIVGNDSGYSKALTDTISNDISQRAKNAPQSLIVSAQTSDFNTALTTEAAKQADLLIYTAYVTQMENFVNAVKRLDLNSNMLFNDGATNLPLSARNNSKIYALEPELAQDKCPRWKIFNQKFQRRFGYPPNSFAGNAYNAAGMLIEAIRKTDSTDGAKVLTYLHQVHYKGLGGELAFAPGGALLDPTYTVYRADHQNWQAIHFFAENRKLIKNCFKD